MKDDAKINGKIVRLLRESGDTVQLYAAARIEGLEGWNEILQKTALQEKDRAKQAEQRLDGILLAMTQYESDAIALPEGKKAPNFSRWMVERVVKLERALNRVCKLIHGSLGCPITLLETGEIDDFHKCNCGECDGNELALSCWKKYFLEEADNTK